MHRNKLKTILEDYDSDYAEEQAYKQQMLNFLNSHQNCFERDCPPGHFTGSSWLLDKTGTKALLTHHAKLDIWVQLGGHCDGDNDVLAVATKEAQEESGINEIKVISDSIFDIDIHQIPARLNEPEHYHYDIRFLLQVDSDADFVVSSESKSLKWFDKNKNGLPTDELSVIRMFDKWCVY